MSFLFDDLVDRKTLARRIRHELAQARRSAKEFRRIAAKSPTSFAQSAEAVIEADTRVRLLGEIDEALANNKSTVEAVRDYALGRVLSLATFRHANRDEMAAWAIVADLTRKASLRAR